MCDVSFFFKKKFFYKRIGQIALLPCRNAAIISKLQVSWTYISSSYWSPLNLWGMTWSIFRLVGQLISDTEQYVENAVKEM